jgi:hypothetical protein
VSINKKNTGIESTNWRVHQSRITKARLPNNICPKPEASADSVIPMAWNLGFVHSITERQHKLNLHLKQRWNIKSKLRLGKCPRFKISTY